MTTTQQLGLLIVFAYALGSVPFGLLVARSKGVDPRKAGSGNIGATNVGRLLGRKFFILVFTLDLLKGFVPMFVASLLVWHLPATQKPYLLWMLVGAAAVIGHLFPVYLKFKGGKGVATSAGLLLGLFPYLTLPGIVCVLAFLIVFRITHTVSLGSIAAAMVFAPAYVVIGLLLHWPIFGQQLPVLLFSVLLSGLIIYKHRSNIQRLLAGTEHSFRKKKEA